MSGPLRAQIRRSGLSVWNDKMGLDEALVEQPGITLGRGRARNGRQEHRQEDQQTDDAKGVENF